MTDEKEPRLDQRKAEDLLNDVWSDVRLIQFSIEEWTERLEEAILPDPAIAALVQAIHFTVEYVGYATLPAIDGWSWYDALKRYDPELAEHHRVKYEEMLAFGRGEGAHWQS